MVDGIRRQYADHLTSGAYLLALVIGFQADRPGGWLLSLSLVAALGFIAWIGAHRRYRSVSDTPTSRVASAAQGYVELTGRAGQHAGHLLLSKPRHLPCVWYRYQVWERTGGNKWERIDSDESFDTFLLRDPSGACIIDPERAEVLSSRKETWYQGDYKYVQWLILDGDPLYALGEFVTLGGPNSHLDFRQDMGALLADWKRNQPKLLERFDADRDGQLDLDEWERARRAAKREVEHRHRDIRLSGNVTHVMRKPRDGRLYLLSNFDPDQLARRYARWAWFHLAAFVGAGIGAGVYLTRGALPM